MNRSKGRYADYLLLGLAAIIGGGSLIAFMAFLFIGPFHLVDLGLDQGTLLGLDAGLSLLFFLQHSGMVRKSFRRWMAGFTPDAWSDALYAVASGMVLSVVLVFWQGTDRELLALPEAYRWVFRAIYLLFLGVFAWSARALHCFDPLGLSPILDHLQGRRPGYLTFVVTGPYRAVRHPLYLCIMVMIWSYPVLTLDRVLFNILWTLWIVTGAALEERDLVATFGDQYREYQRRVPMLFPCWVRSKENSDGGLPQKGAPKNDRGARDTHLTERDPS